jgi:hypothetical protein
MHYVLPADGTNVPKRDAEAHLMFALSKNVHLVGK